ncbi:hypothetical protein LTR37_007544 [Vermiconidia calcicola]|uniref:Uncharacterized protein n=1 Tax=Vermiconidia calcicola TaxID=1690605 RepID=A0ACC3NDI5_9PEZI|nr:hypothetical protein LTR37_007544 [Vermiconidia calcicola]
MLQEPRSLRRAPNLQHSRWTRSYKGCVAVLAAIALSTNSALPTVNKATMNNTTENYYRYSRPRVGLSSQYTGLPNPTATPMTNPTANTMANAATSAGHNPAFDPLRGELSRRMRLQAATAGQHMGQNNNPMWEYPDWSYAAKIIQEVAIYIDIYLNTLFLRGEIPLMLRHSRAVLPTYLTMYADDLTTRNAGTLQGQALDGTPLAMAQMMRNIAEFLRAQPLNFMPPFPHQREVAKLFEFLDDLADDIKTENDWSLLEEIEDQFLTRINEPVQLPIRGVTIDPMLQATTGEAPQATTAGASDLRRAREGGPSRTGDQQPHVELPRNPEGHSNPKCGISSIPHVCQIGLVCPTEYNAKVKMPATSQAGGNQQFSRLQPLSRMNSSLQPPSMSRQSSSTNFNARPQSMNRAGSTSGFTALRQSIDARRGVPSTMPRSPLETANTLPSGVMPRTPMTPGYFGSASGHYDPLDELDRRATEITGLRKQVEKLKADSSTPSSKEQKPGEASGAAPTIVEPPTDEHDGFVIVTPISEGETGTDGQNKSAGTEKIDAEDKQASGSKDTETEKEGSAEEKTSGDE